jgi:hypothetical protein
MVVHRRVHTALTRNAATHATTRIGSICKLSRSRLDRRGIEAAADLAVAALLAELLDRIEGRGYQVGLLPPENPATARGGDYRFGRLAGKLPCGI